MTEPKLMIAYKATYNKSSGGGPDTVAGIFLDRDHAVTSVKGEEQYGGDGRIEAVLVADLGDGTCVILASLKYDKHNLKP